MMKRLGFAIAGLLLATQFANADNGISPQISGDLPLGQIIDFPIARCDLRPYGDSRAVLVVFLPQGGNWYIWTTDTPTISLLAAACSVTPLNNIGIYTWDRRHWNLVIDPVALPAPPAS